MGRGFEVLKGLRAPRIRAFGQIGMFRLRMLKAFITHCSNVYRWEQCVVMSACFGLVTGRS